MAKKKSSTSSPERSGVYYGVRCPDEDSKTFERAAYLEGFSSVQQWLVAIGRKRARAIVQAASQSDAVTITETLIVPATKVS